jgi:hypothetical protein
MYYVIVIILLILMIFYGGVNNINKIEYNTTFFKNLNKIILFEDNIKKIIKNDLNIDFEDITKKINIHVIPNLEYAYYIDINPNNYYNIENIDSYKNIMIIFKHNPMNKIQLIVKKDKINYYMYDLDKKISITGIFPIYNNSNELVSITVFIMKKPYWYY